MFLFLLWVLMGSSRVKFIYYGLQKRLPYYKLFLLDTVLLPVDLPQNNGMLRLSTLLPFHMC